jgi:nitroreductase
MIDSCIEAARFAPTACNTQSWRFFVVEGRLKNRLATEALGGIIVPNRWVATAPVVVVIAIDPDLITHRIGGGIKGIDYQLLDAGIAGEHFALRAAEIGLGTCWIGWFNVGKVKKILGLPGGLNVAAMLTLGYPDEDPPHKRRREIEDITTYLND